MQRQRRQVLKTISAAGALGVSFLVGSLSAAGEQRNDQVPLQPGSTRPRAPRNPADDAETRRPRLDPRLVLKENQKDIVKDVEKMYDLALELKKEVEKTDSAEILSLQLVKKAQEIEKLAKRIQNLARG